MGGPGSGRYFVDEVEAERRLQLWQRLAPDGVATEVIAQQLGMTRRGLQQFIYRARRAGRREAVLHANTSSTCGITREAIRDRSMRAARARQIDGGDA